MTTTLVCSLGYLIKFMDVELVPDTEVKPDNMRRPWKQIEVADLVDMTTGADNVTDLLG